MNKIIQDFFLLQAQHPTYSLTLHQHWFQWFVIQTGIKREYRANR